MPNMETYEDVENAKNKTLNEEAGESQDEYTQIESEQKATP